MSEEYKAWREIGLDVFTTEVERAAEGKKFTCDYLNQDEARRSFDMLCVEEYVA